MPTKDQDERYRIASDRFQKSQQDPAKLAREAEINAMIEAEAQRIAGELRHGHRRTLDAIEACFGAIIKAHVREAKSSEGAVEEFMKANSGFFTDLDQFMGRMIRPRAMTMAKAKFGRADK